MPPKIIVILKEKLTERTRVPKGSSSPQIDYEEPWWGKVLGAVIGIAFWGFIIWLAYWFFAGFSCCGRYHEREDAKRKYWMESGIKDHKKEDLKR